MESEVALPKATVKQIISKHLSANLRSSASGISETIAELAQGK